MKVIPLGISGFIPTEKNETISVLLIKDDFAIIFDCGTGIKRLMTEKIQSELSEVKNVYVFLSHFHMDHIAGLTWLLKAINKPLHFYIPTEPLIESNGLENIEIITNNPFFGLAIEKWPNFGSINSFYDNVVIENNYEIKVKKQFHSGGSVGYRFQNFAFITDVEPDENYVDFLKGTELLLIDTMYDEMDSNAQKKGTTKLLDHGFSKGNAQIAKKAQVKKLGLIHLNPGYDSNRMENLLKEAKMIFNEAFIPEETKEYLIK
jgi:ribonuclease BN (tRNA processing enzyme)